MVNDEFDCSTLTTPVDYKASYTKLTISLNNPPSFQATDPVLFVIVHH